MKERKRTVTEERAYVEMLEQLDAVETTARQTLLKMTAIPQDWYRLEEQVPVRTRKEKLTAAFDADLVKWFRSMGHGYQARMNAVLRCYMLSVIAKEIRRRRDYDAMGNPM